MKRLVGFLTLLIIILTSQTYAAEWFVRPSGGSYGSENGTSYSNAWDGLGNVIWGTNGVQAGDTLYVCGLHLRHYTSHPPGSLLWDIGSGTSGNRITIRGDYQDDPGVIWGGAILDVNPWASLGSNTYSQNLICLPLSRNMKHSLETYRLRKHHFSFLFRRKKSLRLGL